MKNFNKHSSHGHHGSKRRNMLEQHAGSHTFTHILTSTQLQPLCAKHKLAYYRIWNQIFILKGLKVPFRKGFCNREYKNQIQEDAMLI